MGEVRRRKKARQRARRYRHRAARAVAAIESLAKLQLSAGDYEDARWRRADLLMHELGVQAGRFMFRNGGIAEFLMRVKPPLGMRCAVKRGEVEWDPSTLTRPFGEGLFPSQLFREPP